MCGLNLNPPDIGIGFPRRFWVRHPECEPLIGQQTPGFVGPFDGHDPRSLEILQYAEIQDVLLALGPEKIHMGERTPAVKLMDEYKGRTGDRAIRNPQALGQPLD